MGVPKSKITRSKRGLRRAHDGIISGQYVECSNCGEFKYLITYVVPAVIMVQEINREEYSIK